MGRETAGKVHVILRKMVDDMMAMPLNAANAPDRWAILKLAVEVFSVKDADVGRLAVALGLEANTTDTRIAEW